MLQQIQIDDPTRPRVDFAGKTGNMAYESGYRRYFQRTGKGGSSQAPVGEKRHPCRDLRRIKIRVVLVRDEARRWHPPEGSQEGLRDCPTAGPGMGDDRRRLA